MSRQMLESVQKFACKVCLKHWNMDYDNMLHCLDLPLIHVSHQHLKLITMFNIVYGSSFSCRYLQSTLAFFTEKQFICILQTPFSHQLLVSTVWNTLPVGVRLSSFVSLSLLSITYCTWLMSCINLQLFTVAFVLYFSLSPLYKNELKICAASLNASQKLI